jgi:hypothetical protein
VRPDGFSEDAYTLEATAQPLVVIIEALQHYRDTIGLHPAKRGNADVIINEILHYVTQLPSTKEREAILSKFGIRKIGS